MKVILTWLLILSGTIFFQEKISLDALLRNPFDLHKFKKAKGPSNSGGADLRYYYFKPDEDGVYFRFFLFTKKMGYVYDSREHKRHPVRPGTGLQIITYKPKGKYFEDYFDSNETLIEVSASYNDEDLPELAFVGLDTLIIKQKLGLEFIRKDSCFIYAKENNVLVLRVAEGVVKCLKYTRLNVKVTEAALPQGLTEINCSNQPVR